MAKKDDTVSKRLAEEIAVAKRITDGIKNNPPSPSLLDLATPDQLDELASSLWLNEKDPVFGSVTRAFKAFGLDHRNNSDWYSLVARLARVLFPIRRPSGKKKKWTAERLYLLLAQVASYKCERPKASDMDICRWLLKKSYADEKLEALRRALHDARNPKRNSELAWLADLVARKGNWTRAKGVSWERGRALDRALRTGEITTPQFPQLIAFGRGCCAFFVGRDGLCGPRWSDTRPPPQT